MSKITTSTVKKVASLSMINSNPSDEFLDKFSDQLSSVITYIDQLQEVDTEGVSPMAAIRKIKIQDLAEDKTLKDQASYQRIRQNIINNFPQSQGNLLIVPKRIVT